MTARKEYERAFGKVGARVNEAYLLELGYRIPDDNQYMTAYGTELPSFDCGKYEQSVLQDEFLKEEVAESRRMKGICPRYSPFYRVQFNKNSQKDDFRAFRPKGE